MTNVILAVVLALFIPGIGQIYEGQTIIKGLIFFIIGFFLYILSFLFYGLGIISFIFCLYSAYDAYKYLN